MSSSREPERKHHLRFSTLVRAIRNGNLTLVTHFINEDKSLLERKDKHEHQSTPLIHAAWNGQLEIVKFLIEAGADINARNNSKRTALLCASSCGHYEVVEFLLDRNANINEVGWTGDSALIEALNNFPKAKFPRYPQSSSYQTYLCCGI